MNEKNKLDTGGGCSICGGKPAVNPEGTLWLCKDCICLNRDYVYLVYRREWCTACRVWLRTVDGVFSTRQRAKGFIIKKELRVDIYRTIGKRKVK